MKPILLHDRCALFCGDSKDLGEVLDENSVDAIVCDPPSGIAFMGKGWDSDKGGRDVWIAWLAATLAPAFRALKPGGHALVWALPRTSHWTATAVENCGFEVRDVVMHLFGTGFPKSMNVGEGRGTALKPAAEHWILARKPLAGTVAANVLAHGTGALNIDACRIGESGGGTNCSFFPGPCQGHHSHSQSGIAFHAQNTEIGAVGRFPANVTLDEEAAALLDSQSGNSKSSASSGPRGKRASGFVDTCASKGDPRPNGPEYTDEGGASRFFYVAKAPRKEKDAGLDHLPMRTGGEATDRVDGSAGLENPRAGAGRTGGARNFHPTVKNIALMRWLIRLITPPGGLVLDPFAGSGTTGVAALAEGMEFVGVEMTEEYLPIIEGRLRHALKGG